VDASLDPSFTPAVGDLPFTPGQRSLLSQVRELGLSKFGPRAAQWDQTATFPFANYEDLKAAGLLGLCVPQEHGGLGADYATYMMVAAEIGRFCGATALTYNMHICSTLWTGVLADGIPMTDDERSEHPAPTPGAGDLFSDAACAARRRRATRRPRRTAA